MTSLERFTARMEEIVNCALPERVEVDEDCTIPAQEYRIEQLQELSRNIRRCAWEAWAKPQAFELARKADSEAAKLAGFPLSPLPRQYGFESGGIIYPSLP